MKDPDYYYRPFDKKLEQFLSESTSIIKELKNDGFRISDSCRFNVFNRELSKFIQNGYGIGGHKFDIALLAEGIRDFLEISAISKSIKIRNENSKELQEVLGGASIPSNDNLTRSRDLQYQLYLAAIFDLSGIFIEIKEPDFTFKYKDNTYSVAAKRINSEKKIQTIFSKAKKQIKKSGIIGLIAFSLDRIIWDKIKMDSYIVANKPDALYDAGLKTLHSLLRTKVKKAAWANRDPLVVGHIASLTIPAILPQELSLGVSSTQLFIPSIDVDENSKIYTHISELPQKMKWPEKSQ